METLILLTVLVWISVVDIKTLTIPDSSHLILIGSSFFINDIRTIITGFLIGGVIMLIITFIGPMGGGDIKLTASLGTWFGIFVIDLILLSFMLGGVIGIYYMIKHKNGKQEIPFGPFIALAAAALWVGNFSIIWR